MTDERFDRDLRAVVDSLTDVHASPELRARVDRVLAGEVVPAPRREARTWLRAGMAMPAVLALAVVVGWAALRPSVVVPAASASPSLLASAAAGASTTPPPTVTPNASPTPTLPPYLAMPVVTVPGLSPATTRVADPSTPQAGGQPHAGGAPQGPYVYQQSSTTVTVVDAVGGSVRAITPPLLAGEGIASVVWSRDWLALVAANPVYPCGIPERRDRTDWRILAAPLGADGVPRPDFGFKVVSSGTSSCQAAPRPRSSCCRAASG